MVDLQSFLPAGAPAVRGVEDSPLVGRAEAQLALGGTVEHDGQKIDLLLRLLPLRGGIWEPTIDGRRSADRLTSHRFVQSKVRVLRTNPMPTRFVAYMDISAARIMGLEGMTNTVVVDPRRDVTIGRLERELFGASGVASVQPVRDYTDTIRKEIDRALGVLSIVEGAVLLLALLIAFNSASINADERARDHATMFAFGLPTRTVIRMGVVESGAVGILATTAGVLVGWLLLGWLVTTLIPQTFPDLGITTFISTGTLLVALGLGVLAVALAPVFTLRKLRRMDIPSTLRVME